MILSSQQEFSDGQVVTSTGASTNIIDLGATGTVKGAPAALTRDIGKGRRIPIVVQVTAASGTNPTLDVKLQQDTVEGFGSPSDIQAAEQITTVGRVTLYVLPEQITQRYLRLLYTLGGTGPSFTIDAAIVAADQQGVVAGVAD